MGTVDDKIVLSPFLANRTVELKINKQDIKFVWEYEDDRVDTVILLNFDNKVIAEADHDDAVKRNTMKEKVTRIKIDEEREREEEKILNSKGGFNRCSLPRLSINRGEKNQGEGDSEERVMTEYEMQILKMRKENIVKKRQNERGKNESDTETPASKRRRRWKVNFGGGQRRKKDDISEQEEEKECEPNILPKRRKLDKQESSPQNSEDRVLAQAWVWQEKSEKSAIKSANTSKKLPLQNIIITPVKVTQIINLFEEL
jgi:hypothetical protein